MLGFVGLATLVPLARSALADGTIAVLAPMFPAEAVLCPLTGLGAWLVWRRVDVGLERKRAALRRWGWVLMLSALWPAALYGAHSPPLAFGFLLLSLSIAVWTAFSFRALQPAAALLILPYTAWIAIIAGIATAHF